MWVLIGITLGIMVGSKRIREGIKDMVENISSK